MESRFENSFYEILISLQLLAGILLLGKNDRWILFKWKIAEKVDDSDFTEIYLILPTWANMFVQ